MAMFYKNQLTEEQQKAVINSVNVSTSEEKVDSKPENEAAEHRAFRALKRTAPLPLFYRRRTVNEGRKPGNIAEWIRRHGGGYDYMLVLDADSLMSGAAMMRMAAAMDRHQGVALLQTVPTVIGALGSPYGVSTWATRLSGPKNV